MDEAGLRALLAQEPGLAEFLTIYGPSTCTVSERQLGKGGARQSLAPVAPPALLTTPRHAWNRQRRRRRPSASRTPADTRTRRPTTPTHSQRKAPSLRAACSCRAWAARRWR